jgi:mRNA-degrading endonuclease RelE of RelBE toxin-antitoxin system
LRIDKIAPQNLCPDGRHRVEAAPNASSALRDLPDSDRARLIDMLCDIAEVSALAESGIDLRRGGLLSLRLGPSRILYSVDAESRVVIHHVVVAEALPRIAWR